MLYLVAREKSCNDHLRCYEYQSTYGTMPLTIGFDLCEETNEESIKWIATLAKTNHSQLDNESLILASSSFNITPTTRSLLEGFEFLIYSDQLELDLVVVKRRVQMIFRWCSQPALINPLSVPMFIVGERNTNNPNGMSIINWMKSIEETGGDYYPTVNKIFKERVIEPMLRVVPTVGYNIDSGFSAVFIGSYPQEQINIIRCNLEIPQKIEPPITALGNLKKTVQDIQSSKAIPGGKTGNGTRKLQKIKLLCNWASSEQLLNDWSGMLVGTAWDSKYEWISSGEPDYWVIINKPPPGESFDPLRTIVYRMEPYIDNIPEYNDWLADHVKTDFLFFLDHAHFRNNSEWWLKSSINELKNPIEKTKLISAVISSRYEMEGHKLRIDFIKYIQEHSDLAIDIYGSDNQRQFKDWKGSLPERQKETGLMPYKYHLAAENSDIVNYVTEKFWDGLLCECLVFYWGCSNLEEHINERAFIRLNLNDKTGSLQRIQDAIANDEHAKRLPIIRREKERVLCLYHCFARTPCLIESKRINFIQLVQSGDQPLQGISGITLEHRLIDSNLRLEDRASLLINYMLPSIRPSDLIQMCEHKKIWDQTVRSNRVHCIIGGQARSNFLDHMTEILAYPLVAGLEWDIIYLYSAARINKRLNDTLPVSPESNLVLISFTSHLAENSEIQSDGQRISHPTESSSGYLLHPRGALKLINFINKNGFIMPLDLFVMLANSFIPDFHSFISQKNLINEGLKPIESAPIQIMRKNQEGNWENGFCPFNPSGSLKNREIMFMGPLRSP
jgi:hypothetical protein